MQPRQVPRVRPPVDVASTDTLSCRRDSHATEPSQLRVGAGCIRKAWNDGNEELDKGSCARPREVSRGS